MPFLWFLLPSIWQQQSWSGLQGLPTAATILQQYVYSNWDQQYQVCLRKPAYVTVCSNSWHTYATLPDLPQMWGSGTETNMPSNLPHACSVSHSIHQRSTVRQLTCTCTSYTYPYLQLSGLVFCLQSEVDFEALGPCVLYLWTWGTAVQELQEDKRLWINNSMFRCVHRATCITLANLE